MELLLDIGNSSVNWAVQNQDSFTSTGAFSYTTNKFELDLNENLSNHEQPDSVLVSNVAGEKIYRLLDNWTNEHWQQACWQPAVAKHFKELKNSYTDTKQMGIDRWLAMIAAWEANQTALCIIGCGTALTIDLVDAEGNHSGGFIIPGIELMQKALVNNTVQINSDIDKKASIEYANDTQKAINNGAFLAAVSTIERVFQTFSGDSNTEVKCIISGGMANSIQSLLGHKTEYEPDLVLKGLSILHKASR